MKHHPDLFDARTLHNDTRLLFKLKLLLGTVCAYGGEIPLSHSELAKRMGTSNYRVRTLLSKLVHEGIVYYDDRDKLFFNRFVFVQEKEDTTKDDLYSKNFHFFTCEEFLSENRNVQRFVLHYVGKELVYLPGNWKWGHIKDLYGTEGLLNIRTRKEALLILEKASKYLKIKVCDENYQVLHVHQKWLDMGEVYSEGAELWVFKQLKKHRFCCDFLSRKALWQLAKVMEDYYAKFGYDYATEIFDTALYSIQKNKARSQTFFNLIYKEESEYVVNDEKNELEEISAYFRAVMESAELNYAVQMSMDFDALTKKRQLAEQNLFEDGELSSINQQVIEESSTQIKEVWEKLLHIQRCWLRRFSLRPEWFIKHRHQIASLPTAPFYEIQKEIQLHMSQQAAPDSRYKHWAV
ncbi:helix-turn-helix domain-containing protein [Brevibacillus laterosporus]|uniref:helix-turn-helix domain-containing protein n=1 Tax=Brevibacillus laterosporus TaxID=1465 RepID=UPI0018F850FB|nr:helix-turn-helix domain-containing protein [Brevibacillus laterosporus]